MTSHTRTHARAHARIYGLGLVSPPPTPIWWRGGVGVRWGGKRGKRRKTKKRIENDRKNKKHMRKPRKTPEDRRNLRHMQENGAKHGKPKKAKRKRHSKSDPSPLGVGGGTEKPETGSIYAPILLYIIQSFTSADARVSATRLPSASH